ncbi:MAG: hypothetical protein QG600_90 [Patescibacteria group bacterium]|jgi:signal transduction histidine kinase|nr:hypothetical protein [Patescibacteria group bacterium]
MKIQKIIEGVILALLTLVVYLFTINPYTKPYSVYALIFCLALSAGLYFYSLRTMHKNHTRIQPQTIKLLLFTFATAILLWVGSTGWAVSPFFYMLFIVGISVAFLFSTSASFSFVLVLVAILLPNFEGVRGNFDIVTVLSLLLIIPLSYFLSHAYLKVKEKEKKILILEDESKNVRSKVDELLHNQITRMSAQLREPVNDIKQIALFYPQAKTKKDQEEYISRIAKSSEKALELLNSFEKQTTGRSVVHTKKS